MQCICFHSENFTCFTLDCLIQGSFFLMCIHKADEFGRRKNHSKDFVHAHICFVLSVDVCSGWWCFLSSCSSLKSCPPPWIHPLPQPTAIPYPPNGPFHQRMYLLPLLLPGFERKKKITYFRTLHSDLKSLPSSHCCHTLTAHILSSPLTPTLPQPCHH